MRDYIIDGHSDVLLNYLRDKNYKFNKNTNFHCDLHKIKKGKIGLEVFAACSCLKGKDALVKTLNLIDKFNYLVEKNSEVELAKEYEDISKITSKDKIVALLAIEGADGILDLSILRIFYKLGVRLITLCWNHRNHIAEGINEIRANGGVTEFGRKFIKEMNNLGMIIDLSHLTPRSFWDVIEITKGPVVASHSNVKRLCNHKRNLNDKQIKAIAEKNGLIGINFSPEFIKESSKVRIEDIVEHIKYIKNLVGIDYIALGTDYDGISETPDKLDNIGDLPNLFKVLEKNNFKEEEIVKIKRDNWLRVFREIL
ncbi:MAG: dipeptidase [Bacillota bacterium]